MKTNQFKTMAWAILVLVSTNIFSQNFPYGINYQGVARDANGNAETMQNVNLRFTITPSTSTTTIVYQETQTRPTNSMGQFNAVIGTGTTAQTFSNIAWQGNSYAMIVEINPGAGYVIIGTQTLQAVPYALTTVKADTATIAKFSQWNDYAIYQETYISGSRVAGAAGWNTRALNFTQASAGTSISRSGSSITLMPGTYYITAKAEALLVRQHKLCLRDVANNVVLNGLNAYADDANAGGTFASVEGVLTVAVQTQYKLEHFITLTGPSDALGYECSIASVNEVYATILIQKIK